MAFPTIRTSSRGLDGSVARLFGDGRELRRDKPAVIHHGMIGRGHVGKTALFRVLKRLALQYELPSRLQFDVNNPLDLTRVMEQYQQTRRSMQRDGLAQTVESEEIEFRLYEGDTERVLIHSAEVIGQILTNTSQDSPPEQQVKYGKYLSHLSQTDVTWIVIPTPPRNSTPEDMDRYENDLIITRSYLREALHLRSTGRPCSVAIVLTKLDSLFSDEGAARSKLTDESLIEAVQSLVTMMHSTDKIANAIICPVSAFGFGNAVIKDAIGEPARTEDDSLEAGELEWILKPGVSPKPFNLAPLMMWTMLCGLLHQEVDEGTSEPEMARVCRMLAEDLETVGGWYVPVKGPLTLRVG